MLSSLYGRLIYWYEYLAVHIAANELCEDNDTTIISDVITLSSARRNIYVFEPEELNDMTNLSAGTGTIDVIPPLDTSYWSPVKVTGVKLRHSKSMAMTEENSNFRNQLHATIKNDRTVNITHIQFYRCKDPSDNRDGWNKSGTVGRNFTEKMSKYVTPVISH